MAWSLTLIDELQLSSGDGEPFTTRMRNRDGDIYVIMHKDYITTVEITSAGDIVGDAVLDQWTTGLAGQWRGDFLQLGSTDYFAMWYGGTDYDGYLATFSVATTGGIQRSLVDGPWEFDTDKGTDIIALPISGDIYAVVMQGTGNDGYLRTFDVDTSGTITESLVDEEEFDTTVANHPSFIHVSGDIYALVYYRTDVDDMFLMTYDIATDGTITATPEDTWTFYDGSGLSAGSGVEIYKVSGTTYVIAYTPDTTTNIKIFTLTIANDGTITKSEIDSETLTDNYGTYFNSFVMAPLIDDYWAIFYYDSSTDVRARTMKIASNGTITEFLTAGELIDEGGAGYPSVNVFEIGRSADTVYFGLTYCLGGGSDPVILKTISYSQVTGWQGTVNTVENPAAVHGVLAANIQSVIGVESA